VRVKFAEVDVQVYKDGLATAWRKVRCNEKFGDLYYLPHLFCGAATHRGSWPPHS
jgi:hypothetical protein